MVIDALLRKLRTFGVIKFTCVCTMSNDTVRLRDSCNSACGSVYDVTSCIHYILYVRLCALRNSTRRVSALSGLPELGRDPPLRTLGRRISMPRVTQVPSVTVEAHALRVDAGTTEQ